MIARADLWLIERVAEPVAHFTERGFGLSRFNLARFCVILLPVSDATHFWQEPELTFFGLLLFSLTAACFRLWTIAQLEGMTGANPEKHLGPMAIIRIFYIGVAAFGAGLAVAVANARSLLLFIGCAGFLAHLYFAACDRPPPLEERGWLWRTREA